MKQDAWAWGGKVVWGLVALMGVIFSLVGISPYLQTWNQGTIGAYLSQNADGQIILDPVPGREAEAAGVQQGDILLEVNSVPAPADVDSAREQLGGPAGEDVTITVRSAKGAEKTLTITRSKNYLEGLSASGLSLSFLSVAYLALDILAVVALLILGALCLWRKDASLVAMLTAFLLLFLPYSLNLSASAYEGANVLGLYWLFALMRACGLLSIALFLFLFPDGTLVPAWGRWAAAVITLWTLLFYVDQVTSGLFPSFIVDWAWVLVFVLGLVAQGMRYRSLETGSASRSAQNQVMLAGGIVLIVYVLTWLPNSLMPLSFFDGAGGIWFSLLSQVLWVAVTIHLGWRLAFSKR